MLLSLSLSLSSPSPSPLQRYPCVLDAFGKPTQRIAKATAQNMAKITPKMNFWKIIQARHRKNQTNGKKTADGLSASATWLNQRRWEDELKIRKGIIMDENIDDMLDRKQTKKLSWPRWMSCLSICFIFFSNARSRRQALRWNRHTQIRFSTSIVFRWRTCHHIRAYKNGKALFAQTLTRNFLLMVTDRCGLLMKCLHINF